MRSLRVSLLVIALICVVCSSVFGTVSSNAGKLIITEVAMKESNDWLELYVVDGSVDWYNYRIWRDGTNHYDLPDQTYSTGEHIVLHEESGPDGLVSGCWHFYGVLGSGLTGTDQNIFVTEPGAISIYVDAVIYSNNNGDHSASESKANDLVADDMWNPNYNFSAGDAGAWTDSDDISSGQSLARYLDPGTPMYVDNSSEADWYRSTGPSQGDINDNSLPVTLSSFTALPGDGRIILCWITESEIDNLGFNVCRSLKEDGAYTRINGDLIQGAGSSAMRSEYSFTDVQLTNGRTYCYKLEDVSFDGNRTLHGPIQAIPEAGSETEAEASEEEGPKRGQWGTVKHSMQSGDERN